MEVATSKVREGGIEMNFEKGKLYVRCFDGVLESLFFPLQDVPEGYKTFLKGRLVSVCYDVEADALVCYSGYPSSREEHLHDGEHFIDGSEVSFRKATEEDIQIFLDLLLGSGEIPSISSWIESLRQNALGLDPSEEERLAELVATHYCS